MVKKPVDLEVVILAAGRGRRLEPITLSHSKAMTPILGVPIIERLKALCCELPLHRQRHEQLLAHQPEAG